MTRCGRIGFAQSRWMRAIMAAEASRRSNHCIGVVKLGDRLEQSGVVTQCAIVRSLEVRHRLWNGW